MGQRYRKTEDQKQWPVFSRNQDFAEEEEREPKVKVFEPVDALSKLVHLKLITDGSLSLQSPEAISSDGHSGATSAATFSVAVTAAPLLFYSSPAKSGSAALFSVKKAAALQRCF